MNTSVSHQKTSSHIEKKQVITKGVKVVRNQNSYSDFAMQGLSNTVERFSGKMS